MYRNHVLWQFSASMPKRTVSNQRNRCDTFEFQTLCSFSQVRCLVKFLVHVRSGHCQRLGLSLQNFQTLPQKVGTEKCCLTCSTRNVCKNVSSPPTGLFSRFDWNGSHHVTAPPFTQLFFQSFLSLTPCSPLEILSTTNNLCKFWHSKFQQVSTYTLCRWNDIFTQKWNCSSPKTLGKSPKSPSPLSSNRSLVWNFYLSWSNHLVVSYVLKINVEHLSKHQNKPSDTDRYKGYFFFRRVSQINVYTMKRNFEERSKL